MSIAVRPVLACVALCVLSACGGGGGGGGSAAPPTFSVGGSVTGLAGTGLVLQNNGGDDLAVSGASFTFAGRLAAGATYGVSVRTQPSSPAQTCAVTSGSGTIASANLTSVNVACVTNSYQVGGTVSGLEAAGLVLQLNAGDDLPITADGAFTFPTAVTS